MKNIKELSEVRIRECLRSKGVRKGRGVKTPSLELDILQNFIVRRVYRA